MEITFDTLPNAVNKLYEKLDSIEKLLLAQSSEAIPEAETLLTIQQAGAFLTLSVPTIYGLVSRAEIPVSKKGKRLYFSKQELTDWVKAGRKKTNAETATVATQYLHRKN
jgi:excisionase family DNA binding protein